MSHSEDGTTNPTNGNLREVKWSQVLSVIEQMEVDADKDYGELKVMVAEAIIKERGSSNE